MTKPKTTKTLKRNLDTIFSKYIRLRDTQDNGYGRCVSCGKIIFWKEADCGHFINRVNMSLRYNEKNCNLQCRKCNRFDEGNMSGYVLGLTHKHGPDIIQILHNAKNQYQRYTNFEYETLITHYKKEVKKMLTTKMF